MYYPHALHIVISSYHFISSVTSLENVHRTGNLRVNKTPDLNSGGLAVTWHG